MPRAFRTSTKLKLAYLAIAATDAALAGSSRPMAHRVRVLTKPLLMPALAGSLATSPRAAGSPLRTSTLVAQAFGWGGDVALLRHGTSAFAAGTGSFGVGHAAYISGFARHRAPAGSLLGATTPRVIAGLWAALTPPVAVGALRQDPRLGGAVIGYTGLLATMAATSSRLNPELPASARRLTLAGAVLFMVSDGILGLRKFVLKNPPARLETAVMATYTASQFLLSEGAARASS